jgi:hypothetical protein
MGSFNLAPLPCESGISTGMKLEPKWQRIIRLTLDVAPSPRTPLGGPIPDKPIPTSTTKDIVVGDRVAALEPLVRAKFAISGCLCLPLNKSTCAD